jgi:NTE family protein
MAADYYDEILFEGATFADLLDKRDVPVAVATGTDLSTGSRLGFYQNDFDLLCSDLSKFRLARAAATSSAVPVVLSPITLNNYGGTCGYQYPAWVKEFEKPRKGVYGSDRARKRYLEMKSFRDSKDRPYIHLIDGGVSDNIGVRAVLETLEELGASAAFRGEVGFGAIHDIIVVIVNSHSSPSTDWDKREAPPGFVIQLLQSSGVPIDHYSFDTVEAMKDLAELVAWKRELAVAEAMLAGMTREQAEAKFPKATLHVIDVSFEAIGDPKEREYFMNLPTSFVLDAEQVDRLRDIAGRLLRQSEQYRAVLHRFGGTLGD